MPFYRFKRDNISLLPESAVPGCYPGGQISSVENKEEVQSETEFSFCTILLKLKAPRRQSDS